MDIEQETQRVQGFVDKGNYHAALNIALSAMNECRRTENQPGIDHFIAKIKEISNILDEQFGSSDES